MDNESELQYIIYDILKTQIEFGTYRYGNTLPRIEDTCDLLLVSVYTVRKAYYRLQREGYITLTKKGGSKIKVNYSEQEIDENIQSYFAPRKKMFFDFIRTMPYLIEKLEMLAWKKLSSETLDKLDMLTTKNRTYTSYVILHYTELVYGSLGNESLSHLMRNTIITFLFPFHNLQDWSHYLFMKPDITSTRIQLCREKQWDKLHESWIDQTKHYLRAITSLYENRITIPIPDEQLTFSWNPYRNSSQMCYSLALDLCELIANDHYPTETFLPSIEKLAAEKNVSVSTIRRTLALLNSIGITKSINGVGTKILSVEQMEASCKWTDRKVQKCLLEFAFSMQIFVFSCREIAELTINSMNQDEVNECIEGLETIKKINKLDLITSYSFSFLAVYAPSSFLRTVYSILYGQSFWGYPIQSKLGTRESINASYLAYYEKMICCLKSLDASGFAAYLEELLLTRMRGISGILADVGITEAESLFNFPCIEDTNDKM